MSISNFVTTSAAVSTASLLLPEIEAGIFTRITMTSMTAAWYKEIGNFEAILVGVIILQILIMRYLLILPIDYTKWIENRILLASAVSKRKRRGASSIFESKDLDQVVETGRLVETMLTAIRRLDKEDCFLKSLCELELASEGGSALPSEIKKTLHVLKRMDPNHLNLMTVHESRPVGNKTFPHNPKNNQPKKQEHTLTLLQEAVFAGNDAFTGLTNFKTLFPKKSKPKSGFVNSNVTNNSSTFLAGCEQRYSLCKLNGNEIIDSLELYFNVLSES